MPKGVVAMAGRPRKPTKLHVLQGTRARQDRSREPAMPEGAPPRPPWLSGEAVELWDELVAMLSASRLLSTAHGPALARLAQTWRRWREAESALDAAQERGATAGRIATLQGLARKNGEAVDRLLAQFGLTPASQSKVTGPKREAPEDDPVAAWRKRYGV